MDMTARQLKWYNLGKSDSLNYSSERAAAEAMSMDTLECMAEGHWSNELWYHAGFIGREPEYVQAVRYGAIPASGRSTNYADGHRENGISCVKIIRTADDANTKSIYDVTLGWQDIGKTIISGWYLGGYGSDGEPLLIDVI